MSVNLYDLLDVEPDASSEEIRRAWKDAISDLDPGDRRFRSYNAAAEVLLDPARRAEHDAALDDVPPPQEPEPASVVLPEPEPEPEPEPGPTAQTKPKTESPSADPARPVPTWLLAAVGLVTLAVLAATIWAWTSLGQGSAEVGEQGVDEAVAVAEEAAVPMLSFDYRDLDQNIVSAESFMTSDYAAKHSQLMNDLRGDIIAQQSVVDAEVMGSAVTRTTDAGVDVLVLVNQVTQRAAGKPFLLPVWATLQMVEQDGTWRVDNIVNRGAVGQDPTDSPSDEASDAPSGAPSDAPSDGAASQSPAAPSAEPTP